MRKKASDQIPAIITRVLISLFLSIILCQSGGVPPASAWTFYGSQTNPRIALDDSGNAYAVWEDTRNCQDIYNSCPKQIFFSMRPVGGNWVKNERVDDSPFWAINPDLAIDQVGNVYVVWEDEVGLIYFSRRSSGPLGIWSPSQRIAPNSSTFGCCPAIAVDSSGQAYAVWKQILANDEIWFARRPAGDNSNWEGHQRISESNQNRKDDPAIALGCNMVGVAWAEARNSVTTVNNHVLHTTYWIPMNFWTGNLQVTDGGDNNYVSKPSIAIDGADGNCGYHHVVWQDRRNVNDDIYYSRLRFGSGPWEKNLIINTDGSSKNKRHPSIAVKSGVLGIVWSDSRDGGLYGRYFKETSWSNNFLIDGSILSLDTSIILDGNFNAYLAWIGRDLNDSIWNKSDIFFTQGNLFFGPWTTAVKINDDQPRNAIYLPLLIR